jgi:hypothetical protein
LMRKVLAAQQPMLLTTRLLEAQMVQAIWFIYDNF